MRLTQIEITNFLCFRKLILPVDPELQVVAGPNNAGKSSVVRLLEAFFSDPSGELLAELTPMDDYYSDLGSRTLSVIKLWFGDLTDDERETAGEAYRQRDGQIWVAVRITRAGTLSYEASRDLRRDDARTLYEYVLSRHHFVKVPSVRVGGEGDPNQPDAIARLGETVESILVHTRGRTTRLQQDFERVAAPVEELVADVLKKSADAIHSDLPFQDEVSFELGEFRHALRGMLESASIQSIGGTRVAVEDRGTGFQSALVLGILRYVASEEAATDGNVIFAIEEPEAFLHPQTQRAMASILKRIATDAQLLVTTHSPVVIDSLPLHKIARLPLASGGLDHHWSPPPMSDAEEGRLSRYCSAANSELVFASAVIFVEGDGDKPVLEFLLGRVCQEPGGHFSRGVAVVLADGLDQLRYLVQLANRFKVRSYVLSDKDGLRAERKLLRILDERERPPTDAEKTVLRNLADGPCPNLAEARRVQQRLNVALEPFDAFVLSSDLEGLLVDGMGLDSVRTALGPQGEGVLSQQYLDEIEGQDDERARLGKRLGSKGWEAATKPSGKLKPHLPVVLLSDYLKTNTRPVEVARLETWLEGIVATTTTPSL